MMRFDRISARLIVVAGVQTQMLRFFPAGRGRSTTIASVASSGRRRLLTLAGTTTIASRST